MSTGVHIDLSMDPMEEQRFLKKHADLIRKLSKELHFTANEIESILLIYYKLKKDGTPHQTDMTRKQFKTVLHNGFDMTDTEMCDIITSMLDKSPTIYFHMEVWVRTMSLFLRGTLEEKIEYCFNVYNIMGTKMLTRDQMVSLLSHCIIGEGDTEDEARDLIEVLSNKMDVDRDGRVSFDDFKETVKSQPLLLEAFGQCLPSRLAVHSFLTSFTSKKGKV